jgi:hypothetical protein
MNGQLHALAALPPGKSPRYPLHRRLYDLGKVIKCYDPVFSLFLAVSLYKFIFKFPPYEEHFVKSLSSKETTNFSLKNGMRLRCESTCFQQQ